MEILGQSSPATTILNTLGVALLVFVCYRRLTRITISHIPGPPPDSFILGNLVELFRSQAGETDFKYQREYGDIVRVKGVFGEGRLLISDPKTLQYIFHTSGLFILENRNLSSVDGPWLAMGRWQVVSYCSLNQQSIGENAAAELTLQWNDIILSSPDQSVVLNIASWLSRATMDSIGEAAFDYQFGALANSRNEFVEAYLGLMSDTLGSPTKLAIFMQTVLSVWILRLMSYYSQRRSLAHARHTAKLANQVTKNLVNLKTDALLHGKSSKDILSLLVKSNASGDTKTKLAEEEMLAPMRTIPLAGHETSATSLLSQSQRTKSPSRRNT
ncbi:hypothetical protein AX15_001320 [Amanita polypyramis BW_CC]|nr:hypothetical protein AX15_001320 [Amanita polypyramis BW_CC]